MSPPRIKYRKRRSDDESSDSDSDDEVPPIKRIRKCNGETNIKQVFASKCKNIFQWISALPLKNILKETMMNRSVLYPQPSLINLEEDNGNAVEAEIDVIDIADDTDEDLDLAIENEMAASNIVYGEDNLYKNSFAISPNPRSSSTPFYKDPKSLHRKTNSLSRKPVNGFRDESCRPKDKTNLLRQKVKYDHCRGPITNPSTDVEILLDTREMHARESDDLEVVSEISNRSANKFSRQTLSPTVYNFGQASNGVNSQDGVINGHSTPSTERKPTSPTKAYTAHEVVRLQEKAQYQLLLDKIVSGSIYRPVVPRRESRPAEIQVDLTQDEGDQPVMNGHFRKEVLQEPVNEFLQKYYKPCQLKTPTGAEKTSQVQVNTQAAAEERDEDLQIVEVKLPEYRPKVRARSDFFSTEWIDDLKKTITLETEKRLQIVAAQEEKIERYRKRRDAKIQEEKRRSQSWAEPSVQSEEYPEITPEMERVIDYVLGPGDPREKLSVIDRCECNRMDMATLAGLNWLNDSVINFYLELIKERSKTTENYPSVYNFNSYFYSSLKTRGEMAVMRWTRREDIFKYDILLVPLHLGMHWALCVIDNRSRKIKYYDSMRSSEDKCLRILQNYLVVEMREKKKIAMDPNSYSLEIVQNIPQQMNGSDCGMFTLKYADYVAKDVNITFSQENMQYFRRRMVIEIMQKKLL